MNEVLGLVDSLEATVLEGKKVPFSNNILLNERDLLTLLDKIRIVVKKGGNLVHEKVAINQENKDLNVKQEHNTIINAEKVFTTIDNSINQTIVKSQQEAEEIKSGANDYADFVLANLQLLLTKIQKEIIKIEKNIENGRDVLDKAKDETKEFPKHENQQQIS